MSYVRQGSVTPGTKPRGQGNRWSISPVGVVTMVETRHGNVADWLSTLPKMKSEHPSYPGLYLQGPIEGTELGAGAITYTLVWSGWYATGDVITPDDQPPVYEWLGTTATEDIRTHLDFDTWVTALKADGLNPYNASGQWEGFREGSLIGGDLFEGLESYKSISGIWRKTYVTNNRPTDFSELGFISTPEGEYPQFTTDERNYLLITYSYREMGNIFEVTKEWELSDRRGFFSAVYTPPAP